MEQVFDSEESSSGCESGWTLYLQHSNNIIPHHHDLSCKKVHEHDHIHDDGEEEEEDDDDDDMSMVSDASSGPPHFQEHEEDEYCNNNINNINNNVVFSCDHTIMASSRKRRKILKQTNFHSHTHIMQDLPLILDDTASSPFFSFSNKDLNLNVCNKEALMEDDEDSFSYSQGHSTTYYEL
ncbi:uncharacterized protein [Rutidosis leptorrhynchoides]|uniref:uncharacterized protein n=1 Tax=Rutidosis leptorrhynchoides TaxID=125765 RepID=UPI003A99BFD0